MPTPAPPTTPAPIPKPMKRLDPAVNGARAKLVKTMPATVAAAPVKMQKHNIKPCESGNKSLDYK